MTIAAGLLGALLLAGCASGPPPVPAGAPSRVDEAAAATPDAEALFEQGRAAAEAGDTEAALDLLARATEAEPDTLRYGAEYRQVAIQAEEYDRSIAFFERLAAAHPDSAPVRLQWGYAHVDKIPAAGAITAVILANDALGHFTEAIDRDPTWLALYTRGNSYVYWPAIFGRTKLGIADLERAIEIAEADPGGPKPFHAHAYAALGDGWWRLEDVEKAREVWRRGLEWTPGAPSLEQRLALDGEALDDFLKAHYEIGARVDTSLRELWDEQ